MIYAILYCPRTGSTAMAQALVAGGLEIVSSPARDNVNTQCSDETYSMNPTMLEPSDEQLQVFFQTPQQYDGKLLKIQLAYCRNIPVYDYRFIVMRRNRSEIVDSTYAASAKACRPPRIPPHLDRMMDDITDRLRSRNDVRSVDVCYYGQDFVSAPEAFYRSLDWPIDAERAAKIIKPELYRHRCAE